LKISSASEKQPSAPDAAATVKIAPSYMEHMSFDSLSQSSGLS
jgi:hypothetical protein